MGKKTYEDVMFPIVGEVGFYQLSVCFLIAITGWLGGGPFNFVMLESGHWCNVPRLGNFSHAQQKYLSVPLDDEGEYDQCSRFDLDYDSLTDEDIYALNRTDLLNGPVISCDNGWVYDQSEMVESQVMKFNLVCDRDVLISLAPSIAISGGFLAAPLAGFFSDTLGRRKSVIVFYALGFVAYVMQWLAPNYATFVTGMILSWFSGHGAYLIQYVMVIELVGKKWRGRMGPCLDVIWTVGSFIWAYQASIIRHYWYIYILPIVGYIPNVAVFVIMTESPRWLVVNGRYDEAEKVITKIARINNKTVPEDLGKQLRDIELDVTTTGKGVVTEGWVDGVTHALKKGFLKIRALLRTRTMRKRTVIVTIHWFCDNMMYYALQYNLRFIPGNIYLNSMLVAAVDLPASLGTMFFAGWKYTGRRRTCALSMLFVGLAAFAVIPFQVTGIEAGEVTFIMFGRFCVNIAFTCVYIYTPELHPTEVRNTGMGFSSVFGRIGGMAGPLIGGPLRNVKEYLPNIIFGTFGVISGGLTFLLPETLNRELPDSTYDAEHYEDKVSSIDEKEGDENKSKEMHENTYM